MKAVVGAKIVTLGQPRWENSLPISSASERVSAHMLSVVVLTMYVSGESSKGLASRRSATTTYWRLERAFGARSTAFSVTRCAGLRARFLEMRDMKARRGG